MMKCNPVGFLVVDAQISPIMRRDLNERPLRIMPPSHQEELQQGIGRL